MSLEPAAAPARRSRIRWYWWALAAAAVLSTAVAAFFSATTIAATQATPQLAVAHYLNALVHGKAQEAMRLGGIEPHRSDILLTEKAYAAATDRITAYTLDAPVTRRGVTTVHATVQQGDRPYERTFRLVRTGLPFLPVWRLAPVTPDTVEVETAGPAGLHVTVAGVAPKTGDAVATLRALPGSYPVKVSSDSDDFTAKSGVAISHAAGTKITPTVFAAELSDTGYDHAKAAVEAWLDACIATQDAAPANCPFLVQEETVDGVRASILRWNLVTRPSVDLYGDWYDGGWDVHGSGGSVTATANLTRLADGATAQVTTDEIPFSYSGTVTFTGDGAVFTPLFDDAPAQG
jgi:hypothetical protein